MSVHLEVTSQKWDGIVWKPPFFTEVLIINMFLCRSLTVPWRTQIHHVAKHFLMAAGCSIVCTYQFIFSTEAWLIRLFAVKYVMKNIDVVKSLCMSLAIFVGFSPRSRIAPPCKWPSSPPGRWYHLRLLPAGREQPVCPRPTSIGNCPFKQIVISAVENCRACDCVVAEFILSRT